MTLCQLFHVFRDRASVPTGIKEFHLQIASKHNRGYNPCWASHKLFKISPTFTHYSTCMSSSSLHSLSSISSVRSVDTDSTLYRPAKVFTNQDMPLQLKMMFRTSRDILEKKVEMERGQVVCRTVRVSRTRKLTRWFRRRRFK